MEKKSINNLMIGDKLTDVFVLANLFQKGDAINGLLKNKEGEINCIFSCKSTIEELKPLMGGAVKVTAIAKPGADRKVILSVKSVEKPEKSEYKSSDLFDGLDRKVIDKYISSIKKNINFIKDEFYRGLVNAIMTDEVLSGLSQHPATCSGMGTYKGGALAVTANVLEIAKQLGCAYVTLSNGLHSDNIDWSLVLTAASIMECASKEAYTCVEPFQKTEKCIERGYGSLLQSAIEKTFYKPYSKCNVRWCCKSIFLKSSYFSSPKNDFPSLCMGYL